MTVGMKFLFFGLLSLFLLYLGYIVMLPENPESITSLSTPRACGGIIGLDCPIGYKCVYPTPMYPDAMGTCEAGRETDAQLSLTDLYDQFQAKSYEIKFWLNARVSEILNPETEQLIGL